MQRLFGLCTSPLCCVQTFGLLAAQGDTSYDRLGDALSHDPTTGKSAPHHAALCVRHDAHQATATHAIILGDKEKLNLYQIAECGRSGRGRLCQGRARAAAICAWSSRSTPASYSIRTRYSRVCVVAQRDILPWGYPCLRQHRGVPHPHGAWSGINTGVRHDMGPIRSAA